ncbi:MAG: HK97 gp10 family phage protein [Rhodocyclaceae bacterium]|nr:HK97 gp10 family phage protein [Rhodocyclaceae bacterium]
MSNSGTVRVTGLRELNDALAKLADDVAIKHARGAVAAGAALIRDAARANVPVRSGKLKAAIYSAWIREASSRERQSFFVSVRRGKKYQPRMKVGRGGKQRATKDLDAYYWTWIEFGHIATGGMKIKGGTKRRARTRANMREAGAKFVAARPFLRPAFEANKLKAIEVIRAELAKRLFEGVRG